MSSESIQRLSIKVFSFERLILSYRYHRRPNISVTSYHRPRGFKKHPQANDILAKRLSNGEVWLNPNLPEKVDSIDVQNRVLIHEVKYWTLKDHGVPEDQARLEAERAELCGLTKEEIAKYTAILDTISNGQRWHQN